VQHLTAGAGSYAAAEAANAAVLQPLTASAGSFTSATTLQGQILNLLNSASAAFGQLLNSLRGFLHQLTLDTLAFLAFLTALFIQYVLPVINLALSVLVLL
jgi:hypothetical protein